MGAVGAPAAFTGFLVPVREAGILLPQLAVAAAIRGRPTRKGVWIAGALASATSLALIAWAASTFHGDVAGAVILGLTVAFSLARGLCSVAAKDVLGKTVSKSRRGRLMGIASGLSGVVTLALGLVLGGAADAQTKTVASYLIGLGAISFAVSAIAFGLILEQPGATEGGGNAFATALRGLGLLRTDAKFRRFVIARAWMLSLALAPPFFVVLVQEQTGAEVGGLGILIIASSLASSLSAPVWGGLCDRSCRAVMAVAAGLGGVVCLTTAGLALSGWAIAGSTLTYAAMVLLLSVAHSGVQLGRKVHLVDMATAENRATYVAVSNTVIGAGMLAAGTLGFLSDTLDVPSVILLLGLASLTAMVFVGRLPDVSDG